MPEPDFDQMARSTTGFIRVDPEAKQALELNIIDLLRQVWNARGAEIEALKARILDLEQTIELMVNDARESDER